MPSFYRLLALLLIVLLHPGVTSAQTPPPRPAPGAAKAASADAERRVWRFRPEVRGEAEYDHNIFLLPEGRRSAPASPTSEERRSGRYANMASGYDLVGSVDAAVGMRRRGYGGRPFELRPAAGAVVHALNTARNGFWVEMAAEQELRRGRRLQGEARFAPQTFRRNYLSGAVDEDGNGLITPGERRYSPGRASEFNIDADYRHRLRKGGGPSPGVWGEVGAGYEGRNYAAPFAGRSLAGPHGTMRLLTELGVLRFDVGYRGARLAAAPTQEVMLVREGVARRAVTGTVDRSRTEHTLRAAVGAGSRGSQVELEVERRARNFTSTESTDALYRGRRDTRESVALEVARRRGALRSYARIAYARQQLRRGEASGEASGEEDDYTRPRAAVGLRVTF